MNSRSTLGLLVFVALSHSTCKESRQPNEQSPDKARQNRVETPNLMDDSRPVLVAEKVFFPGNKTTAMGASPKGRYEAVFEDDGETGYFYGLDSNSEKNPIVDALHIYNAKDVTDGDRESIAQIVWSSDGLKVGLFINDYPHAVFDFERKRGYSRTNFPPPTGEFSKEGHGWSADAEKFFE